jgi:precorrin-6B methylase 2
LSTLVDVVSENTTFWEIGAKRGYFSLSLAPLVRDVVAVDATKRDLEALEEASVRNGYDNISTHHTLLQEGADLDEIVDLYGVPDVALMDIEGWEEAVLQGADEFLAAKPTMVIEVHDDQQVSYILEAAGYRVAKIK